MEIPTHELQALRAVAQLLNFSIAAKRIHISQSALSQRIQSLERRLGITLLIRDRKAIRLTEAGLRLLRYCQLKDHLETELLNDLMTTSNNKLGGYLRIAGFSSVLYSVIMPTLAPLLRENPTIRFEFSMHAVDDLPDVMMRAEADFVVMDHHHHQSNLQSQLLGYERYVLAQSSCYPPPNIYLDHDPSDKMTQLFFKKNGKDIHSLNRSYVDNINGILSAVALGLGKGIVPSHLLKKEMPIRPVKGMKAMKIPVVLHYFHQPYYSKLQAVTIQTLQSDCLKYLAA